MGLTGKRRACRPSTIETALRKSRKLGMSFTAMDRHLTDAHKQALYGGLRPVFAMIFRHTKEPYHEIDAYRNQGHSDLRQAPFWRKRYRPSFRIPDR
jgi:hypothetical protein